MSKRSSSTAKRVRLPAGPGPSRPQQRSSREISKRSDRRLNNSKKAEPTVHDTLPQSIPLKRHASFAPPSLPPQVKGKRQGEVKVIIDYIVWNSNVMSPSPAPVPVVRAAWWGESGTGTLFRPVPIVHGTQRNIADELYSQYNEVSFPVRCAPRHLMTYFQDGEALTLYIADSSGQAQLGSGRLNLGAFVNGAHTIDDEIPILADDSTVIGRVHINVSVWYYGQKGWPVPENQQSYARAPTKDVISSATQRLRNPSDPRPTIEELIARGNHLRSQMSKSLNDDDMFASSDGGVRPLVYDAETLRQALDQLPPEEAQQLFEELFLERSPQKQTNDRRSPMMVKGTKIRLHSPRDRDPRPTTASALEYRQTPRYSPRRGSSQSPRPRSALATPLRRSKRAATSSPLRASTRSLRSPRRSPRHAAQHSRHRPTDDSMHVIYLRIRGGSFSKRFNPYVAYQAFSDLERQHTKVVFRTDHPKFSHDDQIPRLYSETLLRHLHNTHLILEVHDRRLSAEKNRQTYHDAADRTPHDKDPLVGLTKLQLRPVADKIRDFHQTQSKVSYEVDHVQKHIIFNGKYSVDDLMTGASVGSLDLLLAVGSPKIIDRICELENAAINIQRMTRGYMVRKQRRGGNRTAGGGGGMRLASPYKKAREVDNIIHRLDNLDADPSATQIRYPDRQSPRRAGHPGSPLRHSQRQAQRLQLPSQHQHHQAHPHQSTYQQAQSQQYQPRQGQTYQAGAYDNRPQSQKSSRHSQFCLVTFQIDTLRHSPTVPTDIDKRVLHDGSLYLSYKLPGCDKPVKTNPVSVSTRNASQRIMSLLDDDEWAQAWWVNLNHTYTLTVPFNDDLLAHLAHEYVDVEVWSRPAQNGSAHSDQLLGVCHLNLSKLLYYDNGDLMTEAVSGEYPVQPISEKALGHSLNPSETLYPRMKINVSATVSDQPATNTATQQPWYNDNALAPLYGQQASAPYPPQPQQGHPAMSHQQRQQELADENKLGCHIEVVQALNLPHLSQSQEPTTYAVLTMHSEKSLNMHHVRAVTRLVTNSTTPRWGFSASLPVPVEDQQWKDITDWSVKVDVFHKPSLELGQAAPSMERKSQISQYPAEEHPGDQLFGSCLISLTPFTCGLAEISGWHHVADFKQHSHGQVFVKVRPTEALLEKICRKRYQPDAMGSMSPPVSMKASTHSPVYATGRSSDPRGDAMYSVNKAADSYAWKDVQTSPTRNMGDDDINTIVSGPDHGAIRDLLSKVQSQMFGGLVPSSNTNTSSSTRSPRQEYSAAAYAKKTRPSSPIDDSIVMGPNLDLRELKETVNKLENMRLSMQRRLQRLSAGEHETERNQDALTMTIDTSLWGSEAQRSPRRPGSRPRSRSASPSGRSPRSPYYKRKRSLSIVTPSHKKKGTFGWANEDTKQYLQPPGRSTARSRPTTPRPDHHHRSNSASRERSPQRSVPEFPQHSRYSAPSSPYGTRDYQRDRENEEGRSASPRYYSRAQPVRGMARPRTPLSMQNNMPASARTPLQPHSSFAESSRMEPISASPMFKRSARNEIAGYSDPRDEITSPLPTSPIERPRSPRSPRHRSWSSKYFEEDASRYMRPVRRDRGPEPRTPLGKPSAQQLRNLISGYDYKEFQPSPQRPGQQQQQQRQYNPSSSYEPHYTDSHYRITQPTLTPWTNAPPHAPAPATRREISGGRSTYNPPQQQPIHRHYPASDTHLAQDVPRFGEDASAPPIRVSTMFNPFSVPESSDKVIFGRKRRESVGPPPPTQDGNSSSSNNRRARRASQPSHEPSLQTRIQPEPVAMSQQTESPRKHKRSRRRQAIDDAHVSVMRREQKHRRQRKQRAATRPRSPEYSSMPETNTTAKKQRTDVFSDVGPATGFEPYSQAHTRKRQSVDAIPGYDRFSEPVGLLFMSEPPRKRPAPAIATRQTPNPSTRVRAASRFTPNPSPARPAPSSPVHTIPQQSIVPAAQYTFEKDPDSVVQIQFEDKGDQFTVSYNTSPKRPLGESTRRDTAPALFRSPQRSRAAAVVPRHVESEESHTFGGLPPMHPPLRLSEGKQRTSDAEAFHFPPYPQSAPADSFRSFKYNEGWAVPEAAPVFPRNSYSRNVHVSPPRDTRHPRSPRRSPRQSSTRAGRNLRQSDDRFSDISRLQKPSVSQQMDLRRSEAERIARIARIMRMEDF